MFGSSAQERLFVRSEQSKDNSSTRGEHQPEARDLVAPSSPMCHHPPAGSLDDLEQEEIAMLRPVPWILMLVLSTLGSRAWAAEYVVSPGGKCSDKGPGSAALPFCRLKPAVQKVRAGDKVLVKKGVYPERLAITTSGKPGMPITFEAEEGAILEGKGIKLDEAGLLEVQGAAHIVLRGFTSRHSTFYGVLVQKAKDVVLEKLTVIRSEHGGIIVDIVDDAKVVDNQVIEGNWLDTRTPGKSIHESISICETKRFVVARNTIKKSIKEGICIKDGSSQGEVRDNLVEHIGRGGIYLLQVTKVKVFGNNLHHCKWTGFLIALGDGSRGPRSTSDNEIYQNLSWMNGQSGLVFWQTATGKMTNNRIFNNVFYGNKHYGVVLDKVAGNLIKNNIIAKNGLQPFTGDSSTKNPRSHNLVWENGEGGDPQGENVVTRDPKLVNPAKGDFHLRPGSPAIDAGAKLGLPYKGKAPDLGAFEAQ
jgi:parallel beta-helix repeat protein